MSANKSRPYHAGSLFIPPPTQEIDPHKQAVWLIRARAYWPIRRGETATVAEVLLTFMGPDGRIFPSLETLADRAQVSVKTAWRGIKRLVKAGFLVSIRRKGLFGQASNAYLILDPDDAPLKAVKEPSSCGQVCTVSIYNTEKNNHEKSSMDTAPMTFKASSELVETVRQLPMRLVRQARAALANHAKAFDARRRAEQRAKIPNQGGYTRPG